MSYAYFSELKLPVMTHAKSRSEGDTSVDPHEIYHAAAHTIMQTIDLWCNVDKVIRMAQLIEQAHASCKGELDEEESARDACEESLSTLWVKYDAGLSILMCI